MHSATEHFSEYADRVDLRMRQTAASYTFELRVRRLVGSANDHLARFALSARRLWRAQQQQGDSTAAAWELETMTVLLYEALDTVFMGIQMIDPEKLRLSSSLDGTGIIGEDAVFVRNLFEQLETICTEIFDLETRYNLHLDFKHPVDEREGITYINHRHWQDFVEGSISASFFRYFAEPKRSLRSSLDKIPSFWSNQTVRAALARSNRIHLLAAITRLESASLEQEPPAVRVGP